MTPLDTLEDSPMPSVRQRPPAGPERGTVHACEVTGATRRQLEVWCSRGLVSEGHARPGSGRGRWREFDDADLEVVQALTRLAALGCAGMWLAAGADAVRQDRVTPGEVLVVTLVGCSTERTREATFPTGPAWLVPLTPFSEGRPR